MKAGSMEGLIGADVNRKLLQTPMRVYKDAERRGDTEVMERAMGYVTDFQEKALEYSDKAQKELPKELKEERKEQEVRQEQALERKEEAQEYVAQIKEANTNVAASSPAASVTISEEGKAALQNLIQKQGSSMEENDASIESSVFTTTQTVSSKPVAVSDTKGIDLTV